jgi:hypothetical protein
MGRRSSSDLRHGKKTRNPKTAEKKPERAASSEFDKLRRFVVTFQGRFALAFICGEDRGQRDRVLVSLADLLTEKKIKLTLVDLTFRETTDVLGTLKEKCRQTNRAAIVVTVVEPSLNSNFLASLNVQRDLISQQIKCPILFWVSKFALTLFAREAPDFYDFRYTVFNCPVA